MKLTPTLAVYVVILLVALFKFPTWFVPYHDLSDQGCKITYVYDGDTVALLCDGRKITARLIGFDTPETKSPKCEAEAALGARATEYLRERVAQSEVALDGQGIDKYGRRLVRLWLDGQDASDVMIAAGLAVPYSGGARIDWCRKLRN